MRASDPRLYWGWAFGKDLVESLCGPAISCLTRWYGGFRLPTCAEKFVGPLLDALFPSGSNALMETVLPPPVAENDLDPGGSVGSSAVVLPDPVAEDYDEEQRAGPLCSATPLWRPAVPPQDFGAYLMSLGVPLPLAVDADSDEDVDSVEAEGDSEIDVASNQSVPSPSQLQSQFATAVRARVPLLELYSPPRVVSEFRGPLPQQLCFDLLTGWDFRQPHLRRLSLQALDIFDVDMACLSPPCTMFSALQYMFRNFQKMNREIFERRMTDALTFVEHSMALAERQVVRGREFFFEHPATATSWALPAVVNVARKTGVFAVNFDQCMLGLQAPSGRPFKKRTRILTNSVRLATALARFQCDGSHAHQQIVGQERGHSRSWWAQHYPQALCRVLADAAMLAHPMN